jgi:hypothetical protein
MPHSSGRRAGTGQSDSPAESSSASDSEAGQHRIVRAPPAAVPRRGRIAVPVNTRVACPGCGSVFASLNILKLHRNSYRLANSACRAAASAMKRPRIVPLPGPGAAGGAAADADGDDPGDADDLIDRMMMGDGDRGIAPEAVAADPSRYPRHGDGVSEQNNVCMRCVKCVPQVCIYSANSLHMSEICLQLVCTYSAKSLQCSAFSLYIFCKKVCIQSAYLPVQCPFASCLRLAPTTTGSNSVQRTFLGRGKTCTATLQSRIWVCTGMIVSRARSPGRRGRPSAPTCLATCPGATQSTADCSKSLSALRRH